MAQFNRERVPERVVHAKGGGAHGFFEVTEDVTQWTKARFLGPEGQAHRRSSCASRRSPASSAPPTRSRPARLRHEVLHGGGQLRPRRQQHAGLLHPRPSKFSDFIHSQKRMPDTNLRDNNAQWDFWTLSPGVGAPGDVPDERPRHPAHLAQHERLRQPHLHVGQRQPARFWVKYHFKTDQGIENFTDAEAKAMAAEDPDFHLRDLYDAIAGGDAPEWRSRCRSCRSTTPRTTGSTRSTSRRSGRTATTRRSRSGAWS